MLIVKKNLSEDFWGLIRYVIIDSQGMLSGNFSFLHFFQCSYSYLANAPYYTTTRLYAHESMHILMLTYVAAGILLARHSFYTEKKTHACQ